MGSSGHSPTTIVVVDEQPETAEFISRVMHDAGQSISVLWANSALRLQKNIESDSPHLVIAQSDLSWLPIGKICELCNNLNSVVLALGDNSSSQLELKSISHGAFAYINREQQPLMVLQIDRGLQYAQLLSKQLEQAQQVENLGNRCAALLDTAKEPIAYTSEGVITGANPAFAKLVGASNVAGVVGRLISDYIAPKSLYKFSHALRTLIRGEQSHLHLEGTAFITAGYRTAQTDLLLQNLIIDGEHSTQLLVRDAQVDANSASPLAVETDPADAFAAQPPAANTFALSAQLAQAAKKSVQLPGLSVVPPLAPANPYSFEVQPALGHDKLESTLCQINGRNDTANKHRKSDAIEHPYSANDALIAQSLSGVLTSDTAELCAQPLFNLHADSNMVIARIRTGDKLMPISQVLEEPWDYNTTRWLFTQLKTLAENSKLVLGPISKDTINAESIELLQELPLENSLVLGISEQTLSHDYHGSSQFLLQCQKLKIGIALWMDSTPKVVSDLLNDLPDSVRSGIKTLVLNKQIPPVEDAESLEQDWKYLLGTCQQNKIQLIAPAPEDKEALQTSWQLGAAWCLTPETKATELPSHIAPTGTLPH